MCRSGSCFSCVVHLHQMLISISSALVAFLSFTQLIVLSPAMDCVIRERQENGKPVYDLNDSHCEIFFNMVKAELQRMWNSEIGPYNPLRKYYFRTWTIHLNKRRNDKDLWLYKGDVEFEETACSYELWTMTEFNAWECPAPEPQVSWSVQMSKQLILLSLLLSMAPGASLSTVTVDTLLFARDGSAALVSTCATKESRVLQLGSEDYRL